MIGLSLLLIYLMLPNPIYGTLWIIALALTTQYISIGTRISSAGIAQIKSQLEEAAYTSGASWWQAFRRVLIPLMFPAFMNCALIVFIAAMENLTLPVLLGVSGTEVISRLIWDRFDKGAFSEVAALGLILMLVTSVLALGIRKLSLTGGPTVR
jgi:iron(III) transport system permease protein